LRNPGRYTLHGCHCHDFRAFNPRGLPLVTERLPRVTGLASYPSGCFSRQALDFLKPRTWDRYGSRIWNQPRPRRSQPFRALRYKTQCLMAGALPNFKRRTDNHGINRDLFMATMSVKGSVTNLPPDLGSLMLQLFS